MKYRVLWSPQAEEHLENLVISAGDARDVANAAREFDRQLLDDPKAFGESQ